MKHPLLSLDERVSTHDLGKAVAVTQHTPALGRSALALGSEPRWIGSDSKEETKSGPETAHRWLTRDKKLVEKLALLLKYQNPPVTDLNSASQGLRDFGQFICCGCLAHTAYSVSLRKNPDASYLALGQHPEPGYGPMTRPACGAKAV